MLKGNTIALSFQDMPIDSILSAGFEPTVIGQASSEAASRDYPARFSKMSWNLLARAALAVVPEGANTVRREQFDVLAHAVINSENLAEVLQRSSLFLEMAQGFPGRLRVLRRPDFTRIELFDSLGVRPAAEQVFSQYWMLTIVRWLEWLCDQELKLSRIEFTGEQLHPEPFCRAPEWTDVHFNNPMTAFHLSSDDLNINVARSREDLGYILDLLPYHIHHRPRGGLESGIANCLDWALRKEGRLLDMSAVAHHLGISAATLRRRLNEQSLIYEDVRDRLRKRIALELLRKSNIGVDDVACRCGYSDAVSFRRAFRRWTGLSPTSFRSSSMNGFGQLDPSQSSLT